MCNSSHILAGRISSWLMGEDDLLHIYYIHLCSLREVMIVERSVCVHLKLVLFSVMLRAVFMFCICLHLIAPVM